MDMRAKWEEVECGGAENLRRMRKRRSRKEQEGQRGGATREEGGMVAG